MIRREFKKILLDQQGAAVILWAFFTVSISLYVIIGNWSSGIVVFSPILVSRRLSGRCCGYWFSWI